jgi:gliding motility-associated-like protein
MHSLQITDISGCENAIGFTILSAQEGSIELGDDELVLLGDSVWIELEVFDMSVDFIEWQHDPSKMDIAGFWLTPIQSMILTVQVMDSSGCLYSDEQAITVVEDLSFYVPNVFSPNDDQINDLALISSSQGLTIESLQIYDRWGNQVHTQQNQSTYAWDGKFNGNEMPPGVYAIRLIWKDLDGKSRIHLSDLTLVR